MVYYRSIFICEKEVTIFILTDTSVGRDIEHVEVEFFDRKG